MRPTVRFEFKCTGGPYGDCTSSYDIILKKTPVTVRELIEDVVADEREWGEISIVSDITHWLDNSCALEYRWGKVIIDNIPEVIKDKEIIQCKANGGWSAMNYWLTVK